MLEDIELVIKQFKQERKKQSLHIFKNSYKFLTAHIHTSDAIHT